MISQVWSNGFKFKRFPYYSSHSSFSRMIIYGIICVAIVFFLIHCLLNLFFIKFSSNNIPFYSIVHDRQLINSTNLTFKNCSLHSNNHNKKSGIPKIAHLIWFNDKKKTFAFHQYVCLLSVSKFLPQFEIIFWNNNEPSGFWWQKSLMEFPQLCSNHLTPPTTIYGNKILKPEHQSDIARLRILLQHGGLYLDLDTIIVRELDKLLKYSVVLGAETPTQLGNAFIISKPNTIFLSLWYKSYKTFNDSKWNYHSVQMPMIIAKKYPNLIHIDWFLIYHPNYLEVKWLFEEGHLYEWRNNYAVHLYYRYYNEKLDLELIKSLNTTVGEVLRFIVFGSYELIS